MQLIAPDLLAEAKGLSMAVTASAMVLGLLLWITGWAWHRFWVVLATTLAFGVFGLMTGPVYKMQPLVAGLLLAVSAGFLALALVRIMTFACVGLCTLMIVHSFWPGAFSEPLGCFLGGGLLGLFLFRFWIMFITSALGTLMMAYGALWTLDGMNKLNCVELAAQKAPMLNVIAIVVITVGVVVQFLLERRRLRLQREEEERPKLTPEDVERLCATMKQDTWLTKAGRAFRRAG